MKKVSQKLLKLLELGQLLQKNCKCRCIRNLKHICTSYPSIGPSPSMYRSKTSHSSMTENPAPSSTMITLPVKDSKDSKMVLRSTLFTLPTFHIHFRNPECVRIPWVLAPQKIFGYGAIYKKIPFFTNFCVLKQKKYRARVCTILMPQTFPIASLNPYTTNF